MSFSSCIIYAFKGSSLPYRENKDFITLGIPPWLKILTNIRAFGRIHGLNLNGPVSHTSVFVCWLKDGYNVKKLKNVFDSFEELDQWWLSHCWKTRKSLFRPSSFRKGDYIWIPLSPPLLSPCCRGGTHKYQRKSTFPSLVEARLSCLGPNYLLKT